MAEAALTSCLELALNRRAVLAPSYYRRQEAVSAATNIVEFPSEPYSASGFRGPPMELYCRRVAPRRRDPTEIGSTIAPKPMAARRTVPLTLAAR